MLAHADRTRLLDEQHRPRVVTKNLRVKATFLIDGRVAGTWKSERKGKKATLTLEPFGKLRKKDVAALQREGEALLRFVEEDAGERRGARGLRRGVQSAVRAAFAPASRTAAIRGGSGRVELCTPYSTVNVPFNGVEWKFGVAMATPMFHSLARRRSRPRTTPRRRRSRPEPKRSANGALNATRPA